MRKLKQLIMVVFTLMLAIIIVACNAANDGSRDSQAVRIGSKNFTENFILAEIYALALEENGIEVERVFGLASGLVHTAITNNEIDLYPEYTGTALLTVLGHEMVTDPEEVHRIVRERYAEQFDIVWLDFSSANNGQGIILSRRVSEELGIKTISDLQRNAENIRFASQGEFDMREDGIPLLTEVYGAFNFQSTRIIDNALKFEVLRNDQADAAPAYTTEGFLLEDDFVLLEDDLHAWPPYNIAPITRREILEQHPEIEAILNQISAALDTKTMTRLNWEVDAGRREIEDVARVFFELIR